jgi:hypothetical protein
LKILSPGGCRFFSLTDCFAETAQNDLIFDGAVRSLETPAAV